MKNYEVKRPAALDINSWDHEFHDVMLEDSERMTVFKQAIENKVKQGDVVVDLGTGTGIFAEWALDHGASRVYGIEFNKEILETAKKKMERFGDKFVPILGNSLNIELPEKADLVISETIGNFGDNENCVLFMKDAKKRFLKNGGVMIPGSISQMLAPVSSPEIEKNIPNDRLSYYETIVPKEDYVSMPAKVNEFVFDQDEEVEYSKNVIFHIERDTKITGFKGWFVADLGDSLVIDTESVKEDSSWNHFYVPCEINVSKGDVLKVWVKKHNNDYQIVSKKI